MKCIILAAGFGKRLYPLTQTTPKPFIEVGGKTILDMIVNNLSSLNKIDEFIIVTNHKHYSQYIGWSQERNENITIIDNGVNSEDDAKGAIYDLKLAVDKSNNDNCFVAASDLIFDFSLISFLGYCQRKNASCCLRYYEENDIRLRKNTVINVNVSDKIIDIENKPTEPSSYWICPHFYFLKNEDLSKVNDIIDKGINTDSLGEFLCEIAENSDVYSMEIPGKCFRITTDATLKKARKDFVPFI